MGTWGVRSALGGGRDRPGIGCWGGWGGGFQKWDDPCSHSRHQPRNMHFHRSANDRVVAYLGPPIICFGLTSTNLGTAGRPAQYRQRYIIVLPNVHTLARTSGKDGPGEGNTRCLTSGLHHVASSSASSPMRLPLEEEEGGRGAASMQLHLISSKSDAMTTNKAVTLHGGKGVRRAWA